MDALSGRRQTTKGIWLAGAGKVLEPRTLVLDLEGSDGRERGKEPSPCSLQQLETLGRPSGCKSGCDMEPTPCRCIRA